MVGHGKWWIKCACKHAHTDHVTSGLLGGCTLQGCPCQEFYSPYSCACGHTWDAHGTVVESRREREQAGKHVNNLGGGAAATEAACGALTRFSDLVHGIDRVSRGSDPLPFTDAGFFRGEGEPGHEDEGTPLLPVDTHSGAQALGGPLALDETSLPPLGGGMAALQVAEEEARGAQGKLVGVRLNIRSKAAGEGARALQRPSKHIATATPLTVDPRSDVAAGLLSLLPQAPASLPAPDPSRARAAANAAPPASPAEGGASEASGAGAGAGAGAGSGSGAGAGSRGGGVRGGGRGARTAPAPDGGGRGKGVPAAGRGDWNARARAQIAKCKHVCDSMCGICGV